MAVAAPVPATAGGTRSRRAGVIITARMAIAVPALAPSGTVWRRIRSGEFTTRTSRCSTSSSTAAQRPVHEEGVALLDDGRCRHHVHGRDVGSPGRRAGPRAMPGNIVSPTSGERGGTTSSTTPTSREISSPGRRCHRAHGHRQHEVDHEPADGASPDRSRPGRRRQRAAPAPTAIGPALDGDEADTVVVGAASASRGDPTRGDWSRILRRKKPSTSS